MFLMKLDNVKRVYLLIETLDLISVKLVFMLRPVAVKCGVGCFGFVFCFF